jgi:hypothetical protein
MRLIKWYFTLQYFFALIFSACTVLSGLTLASPALSSTALPSPALSSPALSSQALASAAYTEPVRLVLPAWSSEGHGDYFVRLLELAFAKTADEGAVELTASPEHFSGTRYIANLKNNSIVDIVWHGTNAQRESELLPVRISLLKNLNEYRLLLIRAEDQQKFTPVKTLDELRKFTAGASSDWPSLNVLRNNQLPVKAVNNASLLIPMLNNQRFDYMSRNMFEIWSEVEQNKKNNLAVEQHLMLHGGVPFYFFVNKSHVALAKRIERGLTIAIADGSFDELFYSVPDFKKGMEEIANSQRSVLELEVEWN